MHNVPTAAVREAALERLWGLVLVLGQLMQSGLAERGITVARAHVMWQLQLDGASTQRALSRALRVTARNVTGLVDGLEADGLVARGDHPTDRRATLVSLTPKGRALAAAMSKDQGEFAQLLFENMSEREVAGFTKAIDQVLERLAKLMPPS